MIRESDTLSPRGFNYCLWREMEKARVRCGEIEKDGERLGDVKRSREIDGDGVKWREMRNYGDGKIWGEMWREWE